MEEPEIVRESLKEQMSRVEQETRMVLPGIQALFGFQLVAVFNAKFAESLSENQQLLHWLAIAFTVIATILTMAPAAFHRQAEPKLISARLIHHANCWLTLSLLPLMMGICTDFYLIGFVITKNNFVSLFFSSVMLLGFLGMWFVVPALAARRKS